MSANYYSSLFNSVVKFSACEKRKCTNISIDGLESTDTFNITLERSPSLNSNIRLGTVHGVIEITDDYCQ